MTPDWLSSAGPGQDDKEDNEQACGRTGSQIELAAHSFSEVGV